VAVTDIDDGEKYYAQLRGFLEDQYYQKSAVITWLIPRPRSCNGAQSGFDPSLYIAGFIIVLFVLIQIVLFCLYMSCWISCWMVVTVIAGGGDVQTDLCQGVLIGTVVFGI